MTTATPPKSKRGIRLKDGDVSVDIPTDKPKFRDPFGASMSRLVRLDQVIADTRFQFRADGLDSAYVADLVDLYVEDDALGASIPPIVVFGSSDAVLWLADGFHRHAAMQTAGIGQVEAIVYQGDRRAAMRYALQANTTHGKKRTLSDAVFAYRAAIAEQLVEPGDSKGVAKLLGVSDRWAREITKEARDRANAERDATIQRLAREGKTQREIADQVGLTQPGVKKVLDNKRNSSESYQAPESSPPAVPDSPDFAMQPSPPVDPISTEAVRGIWGEAAAEDPDAFNAATKLAAMTKHLHGLFERSPAAGRVVAVMSPQERKQYRASIEGLLPYLNNTLGLLS
jgi:predicted transcriptional regulator